MKLNAEIIAATNVRTITENINSGGDQVTNKDENNHVPDVTAASIPFQPDITPLIVDWDSTLHERRSTESSILPDIVDFTGSLIRFFIY